MTTFDNEPKITYTKESMLPKIGYVTLTVAGAVGTAVYGREVFNQFFTNDIDLNTYGLATLSATGLFVGATGLSRRAQTKLERFSSRKITAIGGTIVGIGLFTIAAISGRDAEVSNPTEPEVNVVINPEVAIETEIKSEVSHDWPCEIYAPIQSGNGSSENVGSAVALQRFLVNEVGFPEEQVNGDAGSPTGDYVDLYQEKVGVDVSLPWGPETCAVSPFGDDNPATPSTGGWEAGWLYYTENIEPTQ